MNCIRATQSQHEGMVKCQVSGAEVLESAICATCQRHWIDNSPPERLQDSSYLSKLFKPKTMVQRAVGLARSLTTLSEGLASSDKVQQRKELCQSCKFWTGKTCFLCGCTVLKLHLEGEKCPIQRW